MNCPWGDCHIHNRKGRAGPRHNSACLGFHVTTIELSHKTKPFPILHYLFNKILELLQLCMSFLQHRSQENDVHAISFENGERLLEFTSLHTFSNDFDLLCTRIRSADFQKRRLVILFFFQSRMRSQKRSIKHGSYSQTMHFLFGRLERMKIATLKKYTDNVRGQGLDLMHHRSAIGGMM